MLTNDPRIDERPAEAAATERLETVIVGAGQAGLAVGYHLARRGHAFTILEGGDRVGDVWRRRFDSLRLYSPARYDGLPGWGFPAGPRTFPTKDQMADYLEAYAARFELPVRTGTYVRRLAREGDTYILDTSGGVIAADQVVVASGTWQMPVVPPFAGELDPRIVQMHSDDYRNPTQLAEGPALVVGASHSGADVALEVARAGHPTVLCGRIEGQIPVPLESRRTRAILPVLWFLANHVLTMRTPLGRKARPAIRAHGGPLLRVRREDLDGAGVEHTPARVDHVDDGLPVLDDGRVMNVANVVWCTGFRKDLGWIDLPVAGDDGWPEQQRGVVPRFPGLYFVGLPFLQSFGSMLVGGVGRDAERVARHIADRAPVA